VRLRQSLDAFDLIEFGGPVVEHQIEVRVMGLLHFRLSAPGHSDDIDSINVVRHQPPNSVYVESIPRCFPAIYEIFDFLMLAGDLYPA
jgi:hypothetical protein